jgi:hypothetical protein
MRFICFQQVSVEISTGCVLVLRGKRVTLFGAFCLLVHSLLLLIIAGVFSCCQVELQILILMGTPFHLGLC